MKEERENRSFKSGLVWRAVSMVTLSEKNAKRVFGGGGEGGVRAAEAAGESVSLKTEMRECEGKCCVDGRRV